MSSLMYVKVAFLFERFPALQADQRALFYTQFLQLLFLFEELVPPFLQVVLLVYDERVLSGETLPALRTRERRLTRVDPLMRG